MNKRILIGIALILIVFSSLIYFMNGKGKEDKLYIIEGSLDDFPQVSDEGQNWIWALYNESATNLLYNLENRYEQDYAGNEKYFLIYALSKVIQEDKNSLEVYKKIKKDILSDNKILRDDLISLLEQTPTKESIEILISLIDSNNFDEEEKRMLYDAVTRMPDNRKSGNFARDTLDISLQLEKALKNREINESIDFVSLSEEDLISEVYLLAIVKNGAPSGMKMVLDIISKTNYPTNLSFVPYRFYLTEFSNPASISLLEEYLYSSNVNSRELFGASYALMQVDYPDGTLAFFKWVASREDDVSPLIEFVPSVRSELTLEILKDYALGEKSKEFKNQKNKETVKKIYNQYFADRIEGEVIQVQ